jgi:Tfp pilus assembly protein PilN
VYFLTTSVYTPTMWSRVRAWWRSPDFWALCGVALGLVLVLARWQSLHAAGEDLQREIWQAEAEAEGLRPIVQEVRALKERRDSLQSLLVDLVERPTLFQATESVLTALGSDIALERLDLDGLEARIFVRAGDERAVRRFIDSLREDGGFSEVRAGDDLEEAPVPPRFVVLGELRMPWPGGGE